ncbi:LacI family DNA-binding transcriptional regulator [Neorhizobium sp. P12A]|uniref:LacI family transcriptional regulator n=1 Tax=Rhizobium/Agrobacterium group TaxID=227290 RepID=UPI00104C6128|nr:MULTISPECIES: LacI family transcriptional regulator [Rhizobium/Agrobacterium group]KAA0695505.1 LacI family DNA-binding transcriptional regulator [Neorhizobium sp. P12A]
MHLHLPAERRTKRLIRCWPSIPLKDTPGRSASSPAPVRKSTKPTLRTISEMTGFAVTTVSRALGNAPQISVETRKRVHEVAAQIGYLPDRAAQRLKTGKTNVIGVLLDPHEEILGYGISLMHGLAKALKDTPYHLIITPNFINGSNVDAVRYLVRNGMADGLIFSRTEPFDPRVRLLLETGFPFVTHGRTEFTTEHPYVDFDNFSFAYEATKRLISRGRQRPMIILPPRRLTFSQHMLHGFMTAVREAGVDYEIPEEINLDCPVDQIRDFMSRRAAQPNAPDGFACGGEVSALATITGMGDHGLTLGKEYDVVAKRTSKLLSQIQPKVETIYEDLTDTGERMGRVLLARIARDATTEMQVLLKPQFSFPMWAGAV